MSFLSVLVECADVVVGTFDSVSNCLQTECKVLTDRAALCNARSVITFFINLTTCSLYRSQGCFFLDLLSCLQNGPKELGEQAAETKVI